MPAGSGYTISASKNSQSTTLTSQTFATSPTTSVGIALPTGTIAVNAATWAGQPVASATVTISGGANSPTTYTGTTDASGLVNITVPTTSSANPYTVTITKTTGSITGTGTATVTSLASGGTATVGPPLTPTGTIAVNAATWAGVGAGTATVTITGGANVGATYTGTTNASGVVSIVVPTTSSANPYTVTVTKNAGTGTATVTSLASGATATVTPVLTPVKTLTLTIQAGGTNQNSKPITLSITGGPNGTAGRRTGLRRRVHDHVCCKDRDLPPRRGRYLHGEGVRHGLRRLDQPEQQRRHERERRSRHDNGDDQHDVRDLSSDAPVRRLLRRLRAEDGISVIEMIVSIAVLGVFFAAFATVVGSSIKHGSEIQEQAVLQTEVRAAVDALTADLRQSTNAGDTSLARISTATATQLTFISPDRAATMHVRRIAYQVTGGQLQRALATSSNTASPWTIPALSPWSTLVRSVVTTGIPVFSYFDANGASTAVAANIKTVRIARRACDGDRPGTSAGLRHPRHAEAAIMKRLADRLHGEEGIAMVLVVFAVALLATLSVVLVDTVTSESTRSTRAVTKQSSFEAAESGLDDYIAKLADDRSYYLHWVHPGESTRRSSDRRLRLRERIRARPEHVVP